MKSLYLVALLALGGTSRSAEVPVAPVVPLLRAHSHNDYEQTRPLVDALDHGFCSVEADIYLVDGKLLVAHDRARVKPERTLESLYLDPLRDRVKANGGHVFRDVPEFHLLIDIKSDGTAVWPVLRDTLQKYGGILTEFRSDATTRRAITVVLSGESPRDLVAAEPVRLAGIDGRPVDLEATPSPHLVPWVSDTWVNHFKWRGWGTMPADERARLADFVARVHAQGRQVRFWGAPDLEAVWREQFAAGVDYLNTDKLAGMAAFLRQVTPAR